MIDASNIKFKFIAQIISTILNFALIVVMIWFFLSGNFKGALLDSGFIDSSAMTIKLLGIYVFYWFVVWFVYLIFGISAFSVWLLRGRLKNIQLNKTGFSA